MLTFLVWYPDGTWDRHDAVSAVAAARQREGAVLWVDLETPTEQLLNAVGDIFGLDPAALDDCLRGEQRPRVDEFADHVFIVLYGMIGADDPAQSDPRKAAVFCGSRFLVTVHGQPLLTIREVRDRCLRHPSQWLGRGVDFVLHAIIDGMVDKYQLVVDTLEQRLDRLEEASLGRDVDDAILPEFSALRRDLLQLRQVVVSHRELVIAVAAGQYDFVAPAPDRRFAHVRDHLTRVTEAIDRQRELLNAVRDNYQATLTARLNAVIKTLTVFATIMLPLGVIASLYGMNVPLWPQDQPWSFPAILAVMALVAGGMLLYLRRRKWL